MTNDIIQTEVQPLRVLSTEAYQAATRGEIDCQVATAKEYPRTPAESIRTARSALKLDPKNAGIYLYAIPRGGKKITGPSIRLAELLAHSWGNLRVGVRTVAVDDKEVCVQATCHDLQNNVAVQAETRRSILKSDGKRFTDDMIVVTQNAAASVAVRNSIFKVIPRVYWSPLMEEVEGIIRDGKNDPGKDLKTRVSRALSWFYKNGVEESKVLEWVDRANTSQIEASDLVTLEGIRTAMGDGDFVARRSSKHVDLDQPISKGEKELDAGATSQALKPTTAVERAVNLGAKQEIAGSNPFD